MRQTSGLASILVLFAFCGQAFAGSPAQELQTTLVNSCVSRGLQRGDDADGVYAFCSCTWEVLSQNLTVAEYVQLDSISTLNGDLTKAAFWNRIKPKLQSCKTRQDVAGKK